MLRSLGGIRVTWASLPGKPNVFVPAAHTHPWSDLTGVPATFPPSPHMHPWVEITNKPTTFTPSAHTHLWADITDRPAIPAATPLGSATPKVLGTASAGTSTNAAREDHVHPLPAGRMEFIGNLNVAETLLIALSVGMKRKTFALAGVQATDLLVFAPTAAPTSGCEVVNVYPASAGNISVGYYTPALGIAAAYSMPIAVYRVT